MARCEGCDTRALPDNEDICDACFADANPDFAVAEAIALLGQTDRYSIKDNETGEWV